MGLGKLLEMVVGRLTRLSIRTEVWGEGRARFRSVVQGNSTLQSVTGKCLPGKAKGRRWSFSNTLQTLPSWFCGGGRDWKYHRTFLCWRSSRCQFVRSIATKMSWPWNFVEWLRIQGYTSQTVTLSHLLPDTHAPERRATQLLVCSGMMPPQLSWCITHFFLTLGLTSFSCNNRSYSELSSPPPHLTYPLNFPYPMLIDN